MVTSSPPDRGLGEWPRLRARFGLRLRFRFRLRFRLGSAITTLDKKACEGLVWQWLSFRPRFTYRKPVKALYGNGSALGLGLGGSSAHS